MKLKPFTHSLTSTKDNVTRNHVDSTIFCFMTDVGKLFNCFTPTDLYGEFQIKVRTVPL